jgi:hypothetical protein
MNHALSNLLISYQMVSCLFGVYLLSFYLTGLYNGSMPGLCSITSLGISGISACEDIKIVLEKSDERKFLFDIEACANLMVRQHMCLSLLKEVEGSWRSAAWAPMI